LNEDESTGRNDVESAVPYPRRLVIRFVLKSLARLAFLAVSRLEIVGRENIPAGGPVILVANHFHFADPVALLVACRRQVEFIGGFRFINAPWIVRFIPHLWGYFPAFRGGYTRSTLRSALGVLEQAGVVAIFPEGGSWATTLRPGRPGAAFLALESQVPVVPVGIDGMTGLFGQLRPRITLRIGRPIGPFPRMADGVPRRAEIDARTDEIMRAIAALIPPAGHGVYSDDPEIREAGRAVAAFPFEKEGMRGM
jgi:1-acyl-sn-glycerol-3-phosphate acyltransferase